MNTNSIAAVNVLAIQRLFLSLLCVCSLWLLEGQPSSTGDGKVSNPSNEPAPIDVVAFDGLPAEEAARVALLPEGFKLHVFAAEPDIKQPIAFCIDHRGRVWVAEAYQYPRRAPEGQGKDRILIFEDTNGDHRFDKRTVFMEGLNLISGMEVGFGGVWVGAAPWLMFIPDRNGDDIPDGKPEILLDGWDFERDTHETLNTFTWGPDGWLYGCHGVFCPSHVGKPGTPMDERQRVDAAVWRYHPVNHTFEVFAEGTSNPWGIDFDLNGQCIIEACVIPHLWHMIQGGRYQRQGGPHYSITLEETKRNRAYLPPQAPAHLNPFIYDDIKTIGDHVHYTGNKGPHAANNRSDEAGGGHAHAGLMMYLGDSWPKSYRNKAFMNNIHGQRINMDILEPSGSGYTGSHGPDFINFNDRSSQALNMMSDQNGSVYLIDWYDRNQCHHNQIDGHDRTNGRIYKIVYKDEKWTPVNLALLDDLTLTELQVHPNEWMVKHAKQLLQERHALGTLDNRKVHQRLKTMLAEQKASDRILRCMWALHVTGGFNPGLAEQWLGHPEAYVRGWTIQLMAEGGNPDAKTLSHWTRLAKNDPSPVVRRFLASAMQRTPIEQRLDVLSGLLSHKEDANGHNLPLLYWYAVEPLAGHRPDLAVQLLKETRIPLIRQYIARRMTAVTSSLSNSR